MQFYESDLQKRTVKADYVICAGDANHTFTKLLDSKYMPGDLRKLFADRKSYPVMTAFQVAFAVDGKLEEFKETNIFSCKPLMVGTSMAERMSVCNYSYDIIIVCLAILYIGVYVDNLSEVEIRNSIFFNLKSI